MKSDISAETTTENCTHKPPVGITLYSGKRYRCKLCGTLLMCEGLNKPDREINPDG